MDISFVLSSCFLRSELSFQPGHTDKESFFFNLGDNLNFNSKACEKLWIILKIMFKFDLRKHLINIPVIYSMHSFIKFASNQLSILYIYILKSMNVKHNLINQPLLIRKISEWLMITTTRLIFIRVKCVTYFVIIWYYLNVWLTVSLKQYEKIYEQNLFKVWFPSSSKVLFSKVFMSGIERVLPHFQDFCKNVLAVKAIDDRNALY